MIFILALERFHRILNRLTAGSLCADEARAATWCEHHEIVRNTVSVQRTKVKRLQFPVWVQYTE